MSSSPSAAVEAMSPKEDAFGLAVAGSITRSIFHFAAAALNIEPSWHFTSRILKVKVLASLLPFHSEARPGCSLPFASMVSRLS